MTARAQRRQIRVAMGAEPQLDALYVRYHGFVRRALRRHYVDPIELEDMTQQVFLVLLTRVDEAAQKRSVGAWLYQIARRVAANHHRWRRRRVRKHGELAAHDAPAAALRDALDPEQASAREEAWTFIREFLQSLDEEACAVFVMSEIEGLRGAEIAARLRLTLPMTYARIRTVRARFDRAVARSRQRAVVGSWVAFLRPAAVGGTQALATGWRIKAVFGALLLVVVWLLSIRLGPGQSPGDPHRLEPASGPTHEDAQDGQRVGSPDSRAAGRELGAAFGGVVVDTDGTGIPDAIVCADRSEDAEHRLNDPPTCVRSDRDGRFRVLGAIATAHTLEAMARGFVPGRVRGRPEEGIRIVLHPGGVELSGAVSDAHGGPIEGAWVSIENRADLTLGATVRTDERGAFSVWVVEGPVSLAAGAEGYATSFSLALAPSNDVRIDLGAESAIAGIVVDGETGEPLEGIRVSALLVPLSERYSNRGRVAVSDATGRWEIRGLQPDQYVLDAAGERSWGRALEAIDLGIGEHQSGIRIEMLPGVDVVGRIFDVETGNACADGTAAVIDRAQSIDRGAAVGEDGVVTVAPLTGDAVYVVRVTCRGYANAEFEVDLREGPVPLQEWPVHRGGELVVRVVDETDTPLRDWRVEVAEIGLDTTAADGSIVFSGVEAGSYRVSASGPGHPPVLAENVQAEGDRSEVVLRTERGVRVSGRVVSAEGMPLAGALVALQRTPPATTERTRDPGPYHAVTDNQGAFEHASVAAGRYGLWVLPADAAVAVQRPDPVRIGGAPLRTVTVGDRALELAVEIGALRSISGIVRDQDGDLIRDARVFAIREHDDAPPDPRGRPRLSDAEGRYRFDDLPEGAYSLIAYRHGGGVARVRGIEAGARDVEVVFDEPGRISGAVRSADGAPVEGYLLVVNRIGTGAPSSDLPGIPAGSKNGRFAATGLEAGRYALLAFAPEGQGETTVDLAAGEHRSGIEITLAPSPHVEGRLVDLEGNPLPGWIVAARKPGAALDEPLEWVLVFKTASDGAFAFQHLPPGPVAIVALQGSETLLDAPPGSVDQAVAQARELLVLTPEGGETTDIGDVVVDPSE